MTSSDSDLEYLSDDNSLFSAAGNARTAALQRCLDQPFAGNIQIDLDDRTKTAGGEYNILDLTNRLVFWTDASVLVQRSGGRTGIAIVWKPVHYLDKWDSRTYALENVADASEAEFFAIAEALRIGSQLCRKLRQEESESDFTSCNDVQVLPEEVDSISSIVIYSDSTAALLWIRDFHTQNRTRLRFGHHFELAKLKERAQNLVYQGVTVQLRWVKGHHGVEGNDMADRLAGKAALPNAAVDLLIPSAMAYLDPGIAAKAKAYKQQRQICKRRRYMEEAGTPRKKQRNADRYTNFIQGQASRKGSNATERGQRVPHIDEIIVISDSEEDVTTSEYMSVRLRSGRRFDRFRDLLVLDQ